MATVKEQIENRIKDEVESRAAMSKNLVVRIPNEMHAQLTQMAQQMSEEIPGRRTTISDVARGILEYALKDRRRTFGAWAYRNTVEQLKD
jgi:hypothetical protein